MLYTSRIYVEEALVLQQHLLEIYTKRLAELQEYQRFRLSTTTRNGRAYYTAIDRQTGKRLYLGKRQQTVAQAIMECRFCEEVLPRIRQNIQGLESLLQVYQDNRIEAVKEILPGAYRSEEPFLAREKRVGEWLSAGQALIDQAGSPYPDDLKVVAFDGSLKRSRLEALNYEAFHIYGIPCLYERPLKYETECSVEFLFPDFTLLDPYSLEEILWECLGFWYHEDLSIRRAYRRDARIRFDKYEQMGFTLSHNLLYFSQGPNGFIDLEFMHRQIRALALPPPSPEILRKLNASLR